MKKPNMQEAKVRTGNKDKKIIRDEYIIPESIKNIGINKTYHVLTYGCQMNEHDSENIKAILSDLGYKENNIMEESDIIILNTCAIRENAHNKVFGMLGRLKHLKQDRPDIIIGLSGCMSQEESVIEEILNKRPYVDIVFGTHNIHRLPIILEEYYIKKKPEIEVYSVEGDVIEGVPYKRDSKIKAWINIMYGCDKFCTYCIVPYTRGSQRSRLKEDIVLEVEELIKEGYKEVTLLGQNVNAYGKDLYDDYNLANLLEDVSKTGIDRIRFVTSHPWDFTNEMIDVIKTHSNIMPYIHLPIQSGSNKILKLMGRRYTKEGYLELFNKLKENIKNVSITTDIIVGFPGEDEEDFKETLDVVNKCKFDGAFTFIYSPREGTPASKMEDNVLLKEKNDRLHRLNDLINSYSLENNKRYLNKKVKVLVEGESKKKGMYMGYTETMKLVNFKGKEDIVGKIVDVIITDAKSFSLDGEIYGK
jgi:tRNA-2-methylthio-N6-dimethylallyladenosine synthase